MSFRSLKWLLLCVAVVAVGCRKRDDPKPEPDPQRFAPIDVVLKINTEDTQSQLTKSRYKNSFKSTSFDVSVQNYDDAPTKAEVDSGDKIYNLNVFLFYRQYDERGDVTLERPEFYRHYYFSDLSEDTKQVVLTDAYIGEYDMFIVANNGGNIVANMCRDEQHAHDKPNQCTKFADINAVTDAISGKIDLVKIKNQNAGLLMTYKGHHKFTTFNQKIEGITLARLMSKMNVKCVVKSDFVDKIDITSVSLKSVATTLPLFNASYNVGLEYSDFDVTGSVLTDKKPFYISSNLKGDRDMSSVTDRVPSKAPQNATYLFVSAQYKPLPSTGIGYMVYLWDGDGLTNFDVNPNVPYNLTVNINQPDFDDPRVLSMNHDDTGGKFKYQSGSDINEIPGSGVKINTTIFKEVTIEGKNIFNEDVTAIISLSQSVNYTLEVFVWDGTNWNSVAVSGESGNREAVLFKTPQDGSPFKKKFKIEYTQSVKGTNIAIGTDITTMNGELSLPHISDSGIKFNE